MFSKNKKFAYFEKQRTRQLYKQQNLMLVKFFEALTLLFGLVLMHYRFIFPGTLYYKLSNLTFFRNLSFIPNNCLDISTQKSRKNTFFSLSNSFRIWIFNTFYWIMICSKFPYMEQKINETNFSKMKWNSFL